jgi:tRNA U55 pseudouridine synthase TruB
MVYLQRCQVGPFRLPQAYSLIALHEYAQRGDFTDVVVPLAEALDFLPTLMLTAQQYEALRLDHGKTLSTILSLIDSSQLTATCYRLCTKSTGPFAVMHQMSTTPKRWRFQYFDPARSA